MADQPSEFIAIHGAEGYEVLLGRVVQVAAANGGSLAVIRFEGLMHGQPGLFTLATPAALAENLQAAIAQSARLAEAARRQLAEKGTGATPPPPQGH